MTLEERVAALEELIQAMMDDESSGHYTSKYSGEEIDALLDKVSAM